MALSAQVPSNRKTSVGQSSPLKMMEEYEFYDAERDSMVRWLGPLEDVDFTGAEVGETTLTISDVNTRLDIIAYQTYRDPSLWFILALRNGLDLPDGQLYKGMQLRVPSLDWVRTKYVGVVRELVRKKY